MRRFAWLLIVGSLLGVGAEVAHAEDEPTATSQRRSIAASNGQHSILVPADWQIEDPKMSGDPKLVIGIRVRPPHEEGPLEIRVYHLPGMVGARAQAYTEKPVFEREYSPEQVSVVLTPRPHLTIEYVKDDDNVFDAHIFRIIRGNGFTIAARCRAELWPHVQDEVFAIVESLESKADAYPGEPAGYEVVEKDGFRYFIHPRANAKDVSAYHRVLRKHQAAFAKRHGPLDKAAKATGIIIFHQRKMQAKKIWKAAAKGDGQNYDTHGHRLFAVPLDKRDPKKRSSLAYEVWYMFLRMRYGSIQPDWMAGGEAYVVHGEAEAGRSLPYTSAWVKSQSASILDFVDLVDQEDVADSAYRQNCALYVALFINGPRVYRNAYKDFLEAYASNGDWRAASTAHLRALDQEKLLRAAVKYLSKKMKKGDGK